MGTRAFVIGLVVAGAMTSSCASVARDALIDVYNDEAGASGNDKVCEIQAKTLATATEAYFVANGTTPTSTSDLVPLWIREAPEEWDFDPDSALSFTPTVGGSCDGLEIAPSSSPSIGQAAVEAIEDGNVAGCVTDKRQVETAIEAHYVINGYDATTIDELREFGVENELNRWTLHTPADPANAVPIVVPVVGGPCDS